MTMTGGRLLAAAIAVALAQLLFLGWIIVGRAAILQNGTEVLLKTEPVDPRDLLRGDYVRLGTDITSIPTKLISDIGDREYTEAGPIYALLKKQPDGLWTVASATFAKPEMYKSDVEAVILGEVPGGWSLDPDTSITAEYGIDRFYVPEGEGLEIEQDMRTRTFSLRVAVDVDSGVAQIKALMDGDKALYEEPPY